MAPLKLFWILLQLLYRVSYSTRPKRGPIEAPISRESTESVQCIPRVLSVAPLKHALDASLSHTTVSYSTRPKRGPIEALIEPFVVTAAVVYSTRPKRGPIEANVLGRQGWLCISIPRVLSVAPLKPDPVTTTI